MLSKDSKIYIAGHHGLVGSAIWNNLKKRGYNNLVGLSLIHICGLEKTCRMYQASTSELYGKVEEVPQNEDTP